MANQHINKVIYGGNVLIDLTEDTASASDVLASKTFHDKSGAEVTGSIPSKSAQTYTPGTAAQSIASGQYLSGVQTISGDANLVAGNIKEGTTIFGVTGEFTGDVSSPISEPVKSDIAYDYTNPAGDSVHLDTEGTDDIVQSDYKGTSSATLEPDADGVSVKNIDLVSGMTMDASNYQYKFGEGEAEKTFELKLNEAGNAVVANNQFTQEVNLLPDEHDEAISVTKDSIVATNGNADAVTADMFIITDSGQEYALKNVGTETEENIVLVRKGTNEQVPHESGVLATLFDTAKGYYNTAKGAVTEAKNSTGSDVADEIAIANKAFAKYTADKSTLADLNANYKSLFDARQNFANDYSDFESSEAAKNVFDAPILTTIENGANEAINVALGEDGAIKAAVNAGVSSAKSYADGLAVNYDAAGSAATAEQNAKDAIKEIYNSQIEKINTAINKINSIGYGCNSYDCRRWIALIPTVRY